MASQNFVDGTTLSAADWFNDVDASIYQGTFPTGATALTVTGATTLAVFNTIATTVNAFGAASVALNIGNASAATAFPGGISIPTGKSLAIAGTGTLTVGGSIATGTGATTTAGLKFINGTAGFASAYGAIYAEALTPDNTNYAFATRTDALATIINSDTSGQISLRIANVEYVQLNGTSIAFSNTTINMAESGTTLTVGVGANNGTVSAGVFTDRTKAFEGDALAELRNVSHKNGEIEHHTLPFIARVKVKHEGVESVERDLGAMISILTVATQQLDARLSKVEAK